EAATDTHRYLVTKGIHASGLRVDSSGRLIVPIHDADGTLISLQFIPPDGQQKRFLEGSTVKGGYWVVGDPSVPAPLCFCEGVATGISIYESTTYPTIVAFSASNLELVARIWREKCPDRHFIICADNDKSGTGQESAKVAAHACQGMVVLPGTEGQDWNDVHREAGSAAVKTAMLSALASARWNGRSDISTTVSGLSVPSSDDWPDIQPVKDELPPVPALPIKMVPPAFRLWIQDVSDRMQCPPDYVAAAAVVTAGSVIGAGCGIRPKKHDDWTVVPNLFGGVVARPSLLKTPAISEAMKPLEGLEGAAKQAFDVAMHTYAGEHEAHKARKEALQADMRKVANGKARSGQTMDELKKAFAELKEPAAPVWRRYKTNDPTIEKMSELQADNPRGLLLFRDELIGFFATLEKDGHEADRAYYLESWNGVHSYTSDRIGRGTIHVDNLCASLFGGIQPTKLSSHLYAAMRGHNNDWLVQRLQVFVYPDEPATWRLVDTPINTSARQIAHEAVKRLAAMDFRQHGALGNDGERIPYYRFDEEGQQIFYQWWEELERKLRTPEEESVVLEHLGKYRSLMPSLALIFHLLEVASTSSPVPPQVSAHHAECAAAWCSYLEQHARRIYSLVTNATQQAAKRLAGKLQQGCLPSLFTLRDVYRKEWSLLDDRDLVEKACEELVTLGWLREVGSPSASGQRGKTQYLINPKVTPHG
ncbi:MAG: DUF3987 domain-containing protein, partial [Nitrospira sp.]